MLISHHHYQQASGWNDNLPVSLDSENTLVMVFGCSDSDQNLAPFRTIQNSFPRSIVIGCSTAGEIIGNEIREDALLVTIVRFTSTTLKLSRYPIPSPNASYEIGRSIAGDLAINGLKAVFILSDGFKTNGTHLVNGITDQLGTQIPVTGGLAGDSDRFKKTWVLVDGLPREGFIVAVGFYGNNINYLHGSDGGWKNFGPERLITHSEDNVLYEIDGKPALHLYKQYLGDMAENLPAAGLRYPISLYKDNENHALVRTILSIDEKQQSLIFAGDIPNGHYLRLMYATFDNLIDGAENAALEVNKNIQSTQDILAIAISCVGRKMVMEEDPTAELDATLNTLPASAQQVGFYSYGELSPIEKQGACRLHNQSMTLTVIYEN
jgi:hypothetical protein